MDPVQEPQFQLQSISRMLEKHDRKTLVALVRMLAKGESGRQVTEEIRRTVAAGYAPYRVTEQENWDQLQIPASPSESAVESALLTVEAVRLGHKSADPRIQQLHLDASIGNWESVIAHGIYSKIHDGSHSYYRRELSSELVTALEVLAERAAAELLPIRRNQTLASYQVLTAYDQEYTALVRQYRMLAFADVTHTLSQWMSGDSTEDSRMTSSQSMAGRTHADLARRRLEFRLDCGVHHLLLDEFQDTAPDQWRILQPLATPLAGNSDSRHSVFCVGDAKQAIYGWRGGVAEVFESVTQSLPAIEQQVLRDSYRSCPEVISAVNEVFSNLNRHSKFADCDSVAADWSKKFPSHRTAIQDPAGYVRLQNGPKVDKDMPSEDKRELFLDYTANQIADITSKSSAGIGVLFRTNADVGRMIAILRDKGVSASQDGGNPLIDSSAVELILSLVHLSDHPGDGICLFHVSTSPLASKLPHSDPRDATTLANWFRQQVSRTGLGTTIESIADMLADRLSWWDQHRLQQLIRLGHEFQASSAGRLREFEEAVEFQRIALPTEAQVKVMTIHKSKGLEFDAVFLPDLEVDLANANSLLVMRGDDPCQPPTGVLRYMNASLQAMLPDSWQRAFGQHKQRIVSESLCMLYVAMTRARVALYMTSRPSSRGPSQQFGSLLQSTLGTKELVQLPETIQFESGDSDWLAAFPLASVKSEQLDSSKEPLKITLRTDLESAPARGLRVAAPSYIGQTFEPIPLAGAFSYSQSLGAIYGTIIHAFFEQIQWLDEFEFDRTELRKVALASVSPEEMQMISLERVLNDFDDLLHLESVRASLSKSRYQQRLFGVESDSVEIDNERIVSLIMDGQLISGTIDRLAIIVKDGKPFAAEIIDFKTDAYDESMALLWLDDRVEHHRPQLDVYAQVVSKLFRIPTARIATYLVMLSTDEFVRVDRRVPAPHFLQTAEESVELSET